MKWAIFGYLVINATLLSAYFETEKHVGGTALLLFNIPIALGFLAFYVIAKVTAGKD
jgi:hypothetical protein